MGIKTELLPVASIGLGSNAVSVLEMASAYATLAAEGVYSSRWRSAVVLADGTVDRDAGWGVSSASASFPTVSPTRSRGSCRTTSPAVPEPVPTTAIPRRRKDGTTDSSADAWFAGYTPKASTVVWVGYPNAQIAMTSVHGITVTGGSFPASIWQLFMSRAMKNMPQVSWGQPKHPAVWVPFQGEFAFVGAPPEPEKTRTRSRTRARPRRRRRLRRPRLSHPHHHRGPVAARRAGRSSRERSS